MMLEKIMNWFERVGTARAAAELARHGYPELAKKLMLGNRE